MANLLPQPKPLVQQIYGVPGRQNTAPVAKKKGQAPSKPAVSPIQQIISQPVAGLAQPGQVLTGPPPVPKTVTKTRVVSVKGPGGASGYHTKPPPKQVTPPHPLAYPPAKVAAPAVLHPHTIQVTPGAASPSVPAPAAVSPIPSRAKTASSAKTAATRGAQAATPAGSTLDDQVNAALKAELDPQTAAINSGYAQILAELRGQQAKATADAAAQAQTIQGYYGALTPLLQGIAPAVQGGYEQAANSIAGAAKGFSGALGDTATADAARSAQLLGENAAPDAQTAAAAQAAGTGGGAANALYGVGGYIPSAELSAQGAAAGAAARQLPATYAGVGAQNAAQALGIGSANVRDIGTTIGQQAQKHAADLATLASGVPKLRNDLTAAYGSAQRQQAQLDFEERLRASEYGTKVQNTAFNQKATTARIGIAQQQANTAAARASRSLDLATMRTLSEITGQVMGPDGKPMLDAHGKPMLTPAGKRAAIAQYKASRPASKGGFTKNQLAGISKNAEKMADLQFYGKFDATGKTVLTPAVQDYQAALSQQLAAGIPLQIAQRALNAFYPVGKEGRPYVPIQARVKLEAAGLPMTDPLAPPNQAQQQWMRANGISWSG